MGKFELLISELSKYQRVIIQTHDFPDHDAIASAFALAFLLKYKGLKPFISYQGYIDRVSTKNLIDWLDIPITKSHRLGLQPSDQIIVVDGCVGEKNVTDLPGQEIAVIDHHQVSAPGFVMYQDIRPEYGATATILVEYFNHFSLAIPPKIATALLVGLTFDTAHFTRAVSPADMDALRQLQQIADLQMVNRICRNQLEFHELALFESILHTMKREQNCIYGSLPEDCPKNMLGVLGDFLLSVNEIDIVVLSARNSERVFVSLRSECDRNDVAKIVRETLNSRGIGYGGGHAHMAGGVINQSFHASEELEYIYDLFRPSIELGWS
ncbi:DHH family phosphoesterase [Vibrio ponticus]|uniref:DHH family phosphoesterase n=1 Tax=Vibrio ponticus TaxID=265668 RepID=A0A3N3DTC2_9VIBR|nr:DHH family phosphoesterase [Vibrio ponticus]ROV57646.1 DHH family phosphoesterase [Vibrio ponticus]